MVRIWSWRFLFMTELISTTSVFIRRLTYRWLNNILLLIVLIQCSNLELTLVAWFRTHTWAPVGLHWLLLSQSCWSLFWLAWNLSDLISTVTSDTWAGLQGFRAKNCVTSLDLVGVWDLIFSERFLAKIKLIVGLKLEALFVSFLGCCYSIINWSAH